MHSSTSSSDRARNAAALWRFTRTLAVLVVVAIVGAEAGLRLAGIDYFSFGTPDPDLGWGNRPNAEGWFRKENPAGVYVRLNSYGMNDKEHPAAKPVGVYRVAVLGNSYTEAFQVPNDQAYWRIAEQEMRRCAPAGKTVEVLNFGVSGYGTAQDLILLEKKVLAFQPDLVILGFLTGGDVWYNHRKLQKMDQAPYYVLRDGKLTLDDSFRAMIRTGRLRQLQFTAERYSRALQWLTNSRNAFRQLLFETLQNARGGAAAKASTESTVKPTDLVYRPPDDTEQGRVWGEAWQVTEALIAEMDAVCKRKGVAFRLVTLTNDKQVHPDPAQREKLRVALGVPDLFYPDRRLREFATARGIDVQTLAPEIAERAAREKVFLHGFEGGELGLGVGHWNADGNRWIGEAVGRRMCQATQGASLP